MRALRGRIWSEALAVFVLAQQAVLSDLLFIRETGVGFYVRLWFQSLLCYSVSGFNQAPLSWLSRHQDPWALASTHTSRESWWTVILWAWLVMASMWPVKSLLLNYQTQRLLSTSNLSMSHWITLSFTMLSTNIAIHCPYSLTVMALIRSIRQIRRAIFSTSLTIWMWLHQTPLPCSPNSCIRPFWELLLEILTLSSMLSTSHSRSTKSSST